MSIVPITLDLSKQVCKLDRRLDKTHFVLYLKQNPHK